MWALQICFTVTLHQYKYALQLHDINTNMLYNYITSMLFIVFKIIMILISYGVIFFANLIDQNLILELFYIVTN